MKRKDGGAMSKGYRCQLEKNSQEPKLEGSEPVNNNNIEL